VNDPFFLFVPAIAKNRKRHAVSAGFERRNFSLARFFQSESTAAVSIDQHHIMESACARILLAGSLAGFADEETLASEEDGSNTPKEHHSRKVPSVKCPMYNNVPSGSQYIHVEGLQRKLHYDVDVRLSSHRDGPPHHRLETDDVCSPKDPKILRNQ